jgi:predicted DCC family thiol-disulfide oxidoreductase YuxK
LLFDGACGICSRWALYWESALERLGLGVAPLQSPWVQEQIGLAGELLSDVRLLRPDGRLISGADVYRFILRRIWWTYPLYLLSQVPGLHGLFDWGYRTFARHRMRISAGCGLDSNPGGHRG